MRWIDFFAGAGGASTGIMKAGHTVVAAINHDPDALRAHAQNHPETAHLNEDVREVDPYMLRERHPADAAWISAECTHFSAAKGGTSRDADSRMLSEVFVHYARVCGWRLIIVENVMEFRKWGPIVPKRLRSATPAERNLERRYCKVQVDLMEAVCTADALSAERFRQEMDVLAAQIELSKHYVRDNKGRLVFAPDPEFAGLMFMKWVRHFEDMGYSFDWRELDSADYGAAQSRKRFFGVFTKKGSGVSFRWPVATHHRNPPPMSGLQKRVACRTILDLNEPGPSIFGGRKPLVQATLDRIVTGLTRYAGDGEAVMIDRYHTGSVPVPVDQPMPTVMACMERSLVRVTTVDHYTHGAPQQGIEEPLGAAMASRDKYLATSFVVARNYNNAPRSLDRPLNTVLTGKVSCLCRVDFIAKDYSGRNTPGLQISGVDVPLGTVTGSNHHNLVTGFLCKYHGTGENVVGLDEPVSTVSTKDRLALVQAGFLVEPRGGGLGNSAQRVVPLHRPMNTVTTTHLPSLVTVAVVNGQARHIAPEGVPYVLRRYEPGEPLCPWTRRDGHYVVDNRIVDIRYRMLFVEELMRAQGFPDGYFLGVAATKAKKFIGNAVQVDVARALVNGVHHEDHKRRAS